MKLNIGCALLSALVWVGILLSELGQSGVSGYDVLKINACNVLQVDLFVSDDQVHSLISGRSGSDFKCVISKYMLLLFLSISCESVLRPQSTFDEKSTLAEEMAWCVRQQAITWNRFQKRSARDRLRYDPVILIRRSHSTNADHDRLIRSRNYETKQFIAKLNHDINHSPGNSKLKLRGRHWMKNARLMISIHDVTMRGVATSFMSADTRAPVQCTLFAHDTIRFGQVCLCDWRHWEYTNCLHKTDHVPVNVSR